MSDRSGNASAAARATDRSAAAEMSRALRTHMVGGQLHVLDVVEDSRGAPTEW